MPIIAGVMQKKDDEILNQKSACELPTVISVRKKDSV